MGMNKTTIMWVVIGILFLAVLIMTFKVSKISGNAVASSSNGEIDTTGWTDNEIMNYEMHGIIPARAQRGSSAPSSQQMIGGC